LDRRWKERFSSLSSVSVVSAYLSCLSCLSCLLCLSCTTTPYPCEINSVVFQLVWLLTLPGSGARNVSPPPNRIINATTTEDKSLLDLTNPLLPPFPRTTGYFLLSTFLSLVPILDQIPTLRQTAWIEASASPSPDLDSPLPFLCESRRSRHRDDHQAAKIGPCLV
jgi:hypothetical protein